MSETLASYYDRMERLSGRPMESYTWLYRCPEGHTLQIKGILDRKTGGPFQAARCPDHDLYAKLTGRR